MLQKNSKFADDAKLKGAFNMLEVRAALQRDLRWLEEQVNKNPMKFHENKCKVLHLGLNNLLNYCMILRYFLYNLFTMQLSFLGFLAFSSAVSHNCQITYGVCKSLIWSKIACSWITTTSSLALPGFKDWGLSNCFRAPRFRLMKETNCSWLFVYSYFPLSLELLHMQVQDTQY